MKTTRLYHRRSDGRIKVWQVSVNKNVVVQKWGELDGRMQSTTHRVQGNQRATDVERARHRYDRLVEHRRKKGYVDTIDTVRDTITVKPVDVSQAFFDRLPQSFAPAKPQKTFDPNEMARWDADGRLIIQRKRDGMRHYLVSDHHGYIRVYTSGKDEATDTYEELLKGFSMPPCTIYDAELTVTEPSKGDRDGFVIVSSIARSNAPRGRSMIKLAQNMGAKVQFLVFDILWLRGKPVYQKPYEDRYGLLDVLLVDGTSAVQLMPKLTGGLKEAMAQIKKHKWEGLVIWRRDQSTMVRLNGSPIRTNCWKLKPVGEEDVVVTGFEYGKGRNADVVGKFRIAVLDPGVKGHRGMKLIPMGKCGTGLTDRDREEALNWKYPCVIQIEYDQKSEKGFRFPVFIRKRDDKKVSEC